MSAQPLLDTVLEVYKGWGIVEHVAAETYYYAQLGTRTSPHFLVPGDALASIAQVKAWVDQQVGIPWIPIVVGGLMAGVVLYFVTRHG